MVNKKGVKSEGMRMCERGLGRPESVLSLDFVTAATEDQDTDTHPFSGKKQLPTQEDVVKLHTFFRGFNGMKNVSSKVITNKVCTHILKYWMQANIETYPKQQVEKKIEKLMEKYKMTYKSKRETEVERMRKETWKEEWKKLFDVASPQAEQKLLQNRLLKDVCGDRKNETKTKAAEDLQFLSDQRGARMMVIGEIDEEYKEKMESKVSREMEAEARKQKQKEMMESEQKLEKDAKQEEMKRLLDADSEEEDGDKYLSNIMRKRKSDTVLVEIPRKLFSSPSITSMLDRTKITSNMAMGLTTAILKTGKVEGKPLDLNEFSMSITTIKSLRKKNRSILAEAAMTEFEKKKPDHLSVHWDSKQMKTYLGELKEWLSILGAGADDYVEGKLFHVASLEDEHGNPTSTGEAQAAAVLEELERWKVKDRVRALVFDTTNSNSGLHKGAAIRITRALGRPCFFFGCRHHVSELIVKGVWYSLFQEDLGPECKFFCEVANDWDSVDISLPIITLDQEIFKREEALDFYRKILTQKHGRTSNYLVRDDYREIAESSMALLGEMPPGGRMIWKKPGARHKAR
jgi:hypothetical protein